MKTVVIVLGVVILSLLGILIFVPAAHSPAVVSPAGTATSTVASSSALLSLSFPGPNGGSINVFSPDINKPVVSPVLVTGTLTGGGWFFEGTFPASVIDANGKTIGQGTIQAIPPEAWMSTGTVSFSGSISFSLPQTATGTLILSKDNPSGLAKNDVSFDIPLSFK